MSTRYAVIADIVGSRQLPDRAAAQDQILATLADASDSLSLLLPPWATVGDEFQALAPDLEATLALTLRTQLLLPEDIELRFGIGSGTAAVIAPSRGTAPPIRDGSAWRAARQALTAASTPQARQRRTRTAYCAGQNDEARNSGTVDDQTVDEQEWLINDYLALRDHVVGRMKARERRLAAGLSQGSAQADLASREGISQSAVSQSLHRSGAMALLRPLRASGRTPGPSTDAADPADPGHDEGSSEVTLRTPPTWSCL